MSQTVMTLNEIHQYFIKGLYKQAVNDQVVDARLFIKAKIKLNPEQSLEIYRGSVIGGLIKALAEIYPAVKRCVGESFFNAMSNQYVASYPSRSNNLDHYGKFFPDFIENFKPLTDLGYLVDLAKLEWLWHTAFHALNEPEFNAQYLAMVDEEQYDEIIFNLRQSIHVFETAYPLKKIWQLNRGLLKLDRIDLNEGGGYLIVWRAKNFEMRIDLLQEHEYVLLCEMKKGLSLGAIFEKMMPKFNSEQINSGLSTAVKNSWISSFHLSSLLSGPNPSGVKALDTNDDIR